MQQVPNSPRWPGCGCEKYMRAPAKKKNSSIFPLKGKTAMVEGKILKIFHFVNCYFLRKNFPTLRRSLQSSYLNYENLLFVGSFLILCFSENFPQFLRANFFFKTIFIIFENSGLILYISEKKIKSLPSTPGQRQQQHTQASHK